MPDLPDHVPMASTGRDVGERGAGSHPEKPAVRIELIQQGVEVALVDAAAMKQDQRALGFARGIAR
jgi:hypothetical protein